MGMPAWRASRISVAKSESAVKRTKSISFMLAAESAELRLSSSNDLIDLRISSLRCLSTAPAFVPTVALVTPRVSNASRTYLLYEKKKKIKEAG